MPRTSREATRQQLIDAGLRLACVQSLASLRVDDVVQAAGIAKGTFYLHFKDRSEYLTTLHRGFHDAVMGQVQMAVAKQPAGLARLLNGSLAYLDACRRDHPVKALLIESRAEPTIQEAVAMQNARFSQRAARDLKAAGWPAPEIAARLWVGMVAEGALAEAEAGAIVPAVRAALGQFLNIANQDS